jgi:CHAT domain
MNQDITVLFLAADPTNESRLRLGEEQREIQEKIRLAAYRDMFHFESRTSVRPEDISQALLDVEPQIVHFAGHGASTGALCFENKMGKSQLVAPEALTDLFGQFKKNTRCVILSSCYSEYQAKAIGEHINYVIGMNNAISDPAAIAFAVGFYQALGAGRSIEDAYQLGAIQILLQGFREHVVPVLIADGKVKKNSERTGNNDYGPRARFVSDEHINKLIANVDIGDWDAAIKPAIEIIETTDERGVNKLFENLLEYQDYKGDDQSLWSAMLVIETCAQLLPSLVNHEVLARMAVNENRSVRSMAASICMDLAQFAPARVPVDILLRLSRYDEDWYVQAPANAALQAIASAQPVVIHVYYQRLFSDQQGERAHAAYSLVRIAKKEPELLELYKLENAFLESERLGDAETCDHLKVALKYVKKVDKRYGYKYGL